MVVLLRESLNQEVGSTFYSMYIQDRTFRHTSRFPNGEKDDSPGSATEERSPGNRLMREKFALNGREVPAGLGPIP